jgi:hypothetical protein
MEAAEAAPGAYSLLQEVRAEQEVMADPEQAAF